MLYLCWNNRLILEMGLCHEKEKKEQCFKKSFS